MRPTGFLGLLLALPGVGWIVEENGGRGDRATVMHTVRVVPTAGPEPPCSKAPLPHYRQAAHVYFIGRATPDTVLAGPGAVRYTTGVGHHGRGESRPVYGQLVEVDRVGEPWRGALPADTRRAVLVPWDYAADCSPIIWGLGARWIAPGTHALYRGQLRDPSQWVDGLPTLDVHAPRYVPYPVARGFDDPPLRRRAEATPRLKLEEALGFFEVLPPPDSMRAAPLAAMAPLEAWAASHPELSERWPASELLPSLRRGAEDNVVRLRPSPLAGTYRLVVTSRDGDSVVFYSRIAEWPISTLRAMRREDVASFDRQPIVGYYLQSRWAPTLPELPNRSTPPAGQYYAVGITPVQESADSTVWRGAAYVEQPASALARADALRQAILALNTRDPDFYFLPGRWITFPDGRVRFEQAVEQGGRRIVAVRAERVSLEALRSRD